MRLGVDFDNTIVGYDALFHRVAREWKCIPEDLPANKSEVRNHLRRVGQEAVWTRMQGVVYGARMTEAAPYPGVRDFFRTCRRKGVPVFIISHKTRQPFLGEPCDLHAAALNWLEQQGFFAREGTGLSRDRVFFELTKEAKLARIGERQCTHFVDDLPEFLGEPAFPTSVCRVLFDPNRLYAEESRFTRLTSWEEAEPVFWEEDDRALRPSHPAEAGDLHTVGAAFLAAHGVGSDLKLTPLPGGANNRVLLVESGAIGRVLKAYFLDPSDSRDRFRAEQALYRLAWERGLRCLPEPLGWDAARRFGLFAYIEGRKLRPDELTDGRIAEALDFVLGVNTARASLAAADLPFAAEACFSLAEHLELVACRVARLQGIVITSPVDTEAAGFVAAELAPAWDAIRRRIEARAGPELRGVLPLERRCVSPSDFGFHNALLAADGRLRFFDFEYAGWDDPAKLVCDFFCQPHLPVGLKYWERFLGALDQGLGWAGALRERADLLLPAYRIKWSCILLNEFLGSGQARRAFAQGGLDSSPRKAAQLAKARRMLETVRAWVESGGRA